MTFNEKVKQLSKIINERLLPIINKISKTKKCVYLELPYYTNIGDTLIWRGTEHFLKQIKFKCLYKASSLTYSEQKMRNINKSYKNTLIFLQGGGNFGDLWKEPQDFRKNIIKTNLDNPIIILPQTVFYNDEIKMKEDAELFSTHKDLTICARDNNSYKILKENFQNKIILVPDMAFCIPQKELQKYAVNKIYGSTLFLKRKDKELNNSINYSQFILQEVFVTQDWITMEKNHLLFRILNKLIIKKIIFYFIFDWYIQYFFQKTMINKGVKQISKYENIYSTRLHAVILSILLEKPFVFFDNSYGKNSSFFETWLHDLDDVSFYK